MGIVFLAYGWFREGPSQFLATMGFGFLGFGLIYGYISAKWVAKFDGDA